MSNADDALLKRMGVLAEGDIIRLRILCQNGDMQTKKVELKEVITSGSRSRTSNFTERNSGKVKTRALYVSWKIHDKKQGRFVQIRRKKGGGCVKLDFPVNAEKDIVLSTSINHFWNSKRKGIADGNKEDYFFHLESETEEPISDLMTLPDNSKIPFTVGNYIKALKLPRPKIYLMTKLKSNQQRILGRFNHTFGSDESSNSDSDFEMDKGKRRSIVTSTPTNEVVIRTSSSTQSQSSTIFPPVMAVPTRSHEVVENSEEDVLQSEIEKAMAEAEQPLFTPSEGRSHQLMGTTDERLLLVESIDREFQESLSKDQENEIRLEEEKRQKEEEEKQQKEEDERLENLKEIRRNRVLPEPALDEPHATILVRHVSMGTQTRIFTSASTFSQVYDWIGSLKSRPEFYYLKKYNGDVISPSDPIESGSYNMTEVESPILLSPDGVVSFRGFGVSSSGVSSSNYNDTITSSTGDNVRIDFVFKCILFKNQKIKVVTFLVLHL